VKLRPILLAIVLAGCGATPIGLGKAGDGGLAPPDAGTLLDAGLLNDGGSPPDGGIPLDGGLPADAGTTADGGPPLDGGPSVDGGLPSDGGWPRDGGSIQDGGPPLDGGPVLDGGSPGDGGPALDGGPIADGGSTTDAGVLCSQDEDCPLPGTPCLMRRCLGGTCHNVPVANLSVVCDDADQSTWGDVCFEGECRSLFKAHLWEPPAPVAATTEATRLRGLHCDDQLSGAYAAGGFRAAWPGYSQTFGLLLKIDRSQVPAVPGFYWYNVLGPVSPLRAIHATGAAVPASEPGGYVAVGLAGQLVWFSSLTENMGQNVSHRRVSSDSGIDYLGVWGHHQNYRGEIYIASTRDLVRGCPYPPTAGTCTTGIATEDGATSLAITGHRGEEIPRMWIVSPRDEILYYPTLLGDAGPNIFSFSVAPGCSPGASATSPCAFQGEFTDLFALSATQVWATTTAGTVLRFDGSTWSQVTDLPPASGTAARSFSTVYAGVNASGKVLVHLFATGPRSNSTSGIDYLVHDGAVWRGPFPLVTYPTAQEDLFRVDRVRGCSSNEPLAVGSAADPSGKQRGLLLVPLLKPF
jgi:hypothetical protein